MIVQSNNSCFQTQIDSYTLEIKTITEAPVPGTSMFKNEAEIAKENPIIDDTNNFVVIFKEYASNPDIMEFRGTLEDCVFNLSLTMQKHHKLGNLSIERSINNIQEEALSFDKSILQKKKDTYQAYRNRDFTDIVEITLEEEEALETYNRYNKLTEELTVSNNKYYAKLDELRKLIA